MGCILGMGVIGPIIGAVKGRNLAAVKQYSVKVNIVTQHLVSLYKMLKVVGCKMKFSTRI